MSAALVCAHCALGLFLEEGTQKVFCSETCQFDANVEIGILKGARGKTNFKARLSAMFAAMADLRNLTVAFNNSSPGFNGSQEDQKKRNKLLQDLAKGAEKVTETSYAVGKMLDGVALPGSKKNTSSGDPWRTMLKVNLNNWAISLQASESLDISPILAPIMQFLDGADNSIVPGTEVLTAFNAFFNLSDDTAPARRSSARKNMISMVEKAGARYDQIYDDLAQGLKKDVKEKKKKVPSRRSRRRSSSSSDSE